MIWVKLPLALRGPRIFQPGERAPHQRVNLAGHLGAVRTNLDRHVLFFTVDLMHGGQAGVTGRQLFALVATAGDDEALRHGLDLRRALDRDVTPSTVRA